MIGAAVLALACLVGFALPGHAAPRTAAAASSTPASTAPASTRTALSSDTGMYPRAVRLQHSGAANGTIVAQDTAFSPTSPYGSVWASHDDGATFQQIGRVDDPAAAQGLCCTTLFELPSRVGALAPGTLLWAGSVGQGPADRRMRLDVYASHDHGRTWSALSTVDVAANTHGLWEPEFAVDARGRLAAFWSDETQQPAHSQVLAESLSSDGLTWSAPATIVTGPDAGNRPGMPNVRRMPNGSYVMSYEVCGVGGADDCLVHLRRSPDADHWGDPTDLGTVPRTADGRRFTATPTLAEWHGRLFLVGQRVTNPDGSLAAGNGETVLTNDRGGSGDWTAIPAPVAVPDARLDVCPNYSSTLVPSTDGRSVLEIATDYVGTTCTAFYGSGPTR
ncbi:hypothetical protein BIV57_06790 [Mangrovactinospora gilvigrisea]|uniref:Exo-alpha-sialidase n=2 Tax=Mangrovactinospora gilvigrisea TaxID=1428644 RepID=A0A1J7BHR3_9ACTN|nr:hypothetical protein BIV57_06790 [Mangrovactinospora gilvigrisea]